MESYNELERFAFLVEAKQKVTSDRGSKVRIGGSRGTNVVGFYLVTSSAVPPE